MADEPEGDFSGDDIFAFVSKNKKPKERTYWLPPDRDLPEVELKDGCTADDFEYISCIGEGGFGDVYRVRHRKTNKQFAMKVCKAEDALSAGLEQEARVMAMLDHPYIIGKAVSFSPAPGYLCLVMELVRGRSWDKIMNDRKFNEGHRHAQPFPEHIVAFYMAELAVGLQFIHDKGVIYRDLKPDNFLLRQNGHLVLIDFGASVVAPPKTKKKLVRGATCIGADGFKAPEMLHAQKGGTYGQEVDWWNYGIILYMMLRGKHPFLTRDWDATIDEEVAKRRPGQKPSMKKGAASTPSLLESLFKKTHKAPNEPVKEIAGVSPAANAFVRKLLHPDLEVRRRCCENIESEPFFAGINWENIADGTAEPPHLKHITPWIPRKERKDEQPKFANFREVCDNIDRKGYENSTFLGNRIGPEE